MDRGVFDWSRWRRILPFRSQNEEEGVLRLDILSLRSSLLHMREEVVTEPEELRSKVRDLWHIGCDILRGYELGNECIEMMGILAYFHPTAINTLIFPNQDLVMMLKDLGFLTSSQIQENTTRYSLISTKFPALIHEIRQKNLQHEVQFLRNIIVLLMSCKPWLVIYSSWAWRDAMTPIWKNTLTHSHGIRFIRDYQQGWDNYLEGLLQSEFNRFNDEEKEVLNQALEIFCVEYGDMGWKTMELRFTQFRLYLRQDLRTSEDVETLLNHSRHYRSLFETYAIDNHLIAGYTPNMSDYSSKQDHISESMYKIALEMDDENSKTLFLQEALAYSVIGYNIWRSTIHDDNRSDNCLAVRLQCLYELGRCDEMVAYMTEIREILMRHPFYPDMCWFPQYVFKSTRGMERSRSEMILNELSIFLNHFYNVGGTGFRENRYFIESLFKCEAGLANWGRISEIVREKKELCSAHIGRRPGGVGVWLGFELTLFNLLKNSPTDALVDELVNESLQFTKLLVEFLVNDGAYGEKYTVDTPLYYLKYDPLSHIITILLVKSRHEALLSYMSEYEKLLEDKYEDRIGPVTKGMLLFGEWLTNQLESQMNIGNKFEELLEGVKAMTQNRMSIISNHPAEIKSWMEVSAHLISTKCDSYLALAQN